MNENERNKELKRETAELLKIVANSLHAKSIREAAKRELVLKLVRRFKAKILRLTDGKIGINDRLTELENSAYMYLFDRATDIAESVEDDQLPLAGIVSLRLKSWAVDKMRKGDGNSLKRGKAMNRKSNFEFHEVPHAGNPIDQDVISRETQERIHIAITEAVEGLAPLEQAVVLSYFGLDNQPELSMREVTESLGISVADGSRLWRKARRKLREQLSDLAKSE